MVKRPFFMPYSGRLPQRDRLEQFRRHVCRVRLSFHLRRHLSADRLEPEQLAGVLQLGELRHRGRDHLLFRADRQRVAAIANQSGWAGDPTPTPILTGVRSGLLFHPHGGVRSDRAGAWGRTRACCWRTLLSASQDSFKTSPNATSSLVVVHALDGLIKRRTPPPRSRTTWPTSAPHIRLAWRPTPRSGPT